MYEKTDKLIGIFSGYQVAGVDPVRLIDDFECDFVELFVRNTEDDGNDTPKTKGGGMLYEESKEEIYWGFRGVCINQVFPAQASEKIPVANAKDIFVRANKGKGGSVNVGFNCYSYESRMTKERI